MKLSACLSALPAFLLGCGAVPPASSPSPAGSMVAAAAAPPPAPIVKQEAESPADDAKMAADADKNSPPPPPAAAESSSKEDRAADDLSPAPFGLARAAPGGAASEGAAPGDLGTVGRGASPAKSASRSGQGAGPAPNMIGGATSVKGRLQPEAIQKVVRQNFGRVRLCYESGLRKNPDLQGKVRVKFVIGKDGAVSNAASGASDLPDGAVVSCVVKLFSTMSFPAPEGGIVAVEYPIDFSPGDAPSAAAPASKKP